MEILGFRVIVTLGSEEALHVGLMDSQRERADWWSHPGAGRRGKYLAFLR